MSPRQASRTWLLFGQIYFVVGCKRVNRPTLRRESSCISRSTRSKKRARRNRIEWGERDETRRDAAPRRENWSRLSGDRLVTSHDLRGKESKRSREEQGGKRGKQIRREGGNVERMYTRMEVGSARRLYAYSGSRTTTTNEDIRPRETNCNERGKRSPSIVISECASLSVVQTNRRVHTTNRQIQKREATTRGKTTRLLLRCRPAKTTTNNEGRAKRRVRWPEFRRGKSAGKIHGSLCRATVWQIVYVYKTYFFYYLLHPPPSPSSLFVPQWVLYNPPGRRSYLRMRSWGRIDRQVRKHLEPRADAKRLHKPSAWI